MLVGWAGSHPCRANTSWAFFFFLSSLHPLFPLKKYLQTGHDSICL